MNKEWFSVETKNGERVSDGFSVEFPNEEAARLVAVAQTGAVDALTLVRYTREEITLFEREVTIKETDVSSASPTA